MNIATIAQPQSLTLTDQQLLMAHANGLTQREIAQHLGTDMSTVNHLNRELQRKLNARTLAHAVAIGFMNGILKAAHILESEHVIRSLCVALVMITTAQCINDDVMRTRTSNKEGRSETIVRVLRAGRNRQFDI
ncbi:TPA: LuxR C-terminal-related transcriptional regulator [Photobacterium damselae]